MRQTSGTGVAILVGVLSSCGPRPEINRGMTESQVLERLGEPTAMETAPEISPVFRPRDPSCKAEDVRRVLLYERWFSDSVLVHLNGDHRVECVETGRMVISQTYR